MIHLMGWALFGCSPEHSIGRQRTDPVPPATPPGDDEDEFGNPPDWNDCFEGHRGMYFNLENTHPDVEPELGSHAPQDPTSLDWWDRSRLAVDQFDASIDFGTNWWPVDDGLEDDPSYFTARWVAWIRVWSDGPMTYSLGSNSDAWVLIDDEVTTAQPDTFIYDPDEYTVDLEATQAHFDVRYAQRVGDENGFRFRVLSGDVTICYPSYEVVE
jgi:hypothetical protein